MQGLNRGKVLDSLSQNKPLLWKRQVAWHLILHSAMARSVCVFCICVRMCVYVCVYVSRQHVSIPSV